MLVVLLLAASLATAEQDSSFQTRLANIMETWGAPVDHASAAGAAASDLDALMRFKSVLGGDENGAAMHEVDSSVPLNPASALLEQQREGVATQPLSVSEVSPNMDFTEYVLHARSRKIGQAA